MNRIDIHCHPSIKPYGRSFSEYPTGHNSNDAKRRNSIWHYSPPSVLDRFLNRMVMGLTKFTQTDMTNLHKGGFSIVIASLSPLEKQFITNFAGDNIIADGISNLVTGVGKDRINDVQSPTYRYFNDLLKDYDFYCQLNGHELEINGQRVQYRLVKSYSQIVQADLPSDVHTLFVYISIEGGHALNNRHYKTYDHDDFLNNVRTIKNWTYPPVFITLAHHFKNHLTGHAQSLTGVIDWMTNQEPDMNGELHEMGREVIRLLLRQSPADGARCLIDIKHLSVKARNSYYQMLQTEYSDENIPLIVSHGAVNGLVSAANPVTSAIANANTFYPGDINFYDDEIMRVAQSFGLFGIQLDERRIANKERLKKSNLVFASRSKRLLAKAELVWNQIRYIGQLLDHQGLDAWNIQTLGSDFDGIIDPVNMYWTAEDMADLEQNLLTHASRFMAQFGTTLHSKNQIAATEIIQNFMYRNAECFLMTLEPDLN
jgi:microsomal dipeptidase-like Zn-dependent dipeptidase